jgi:hypothetical protein
MAKSNQTVLMILITLILLFLAVLIIGYKTNQLAFLIPLLNLASGSSLLIYWIQKQIRITQHIFELSEMSVLGAEMIVVGCAFYALMGKAEYPWLRVLHYVFWTIHFLCLGAFLVFMLTFKIKKLI